MHDAVLVYVHDPMCSWCWAFAPAYADLCERLDGRIATRRLLGGLAPDSDAPMPTTLRDSLQDTWRRIEREVPGTRFNHGFWRTCQPRRSTWPACRAVIAARTLDPGAEAAMITAIQHGYYLEARNPSDVDTLVALAGECGMDRQAFASLLDAPAVHGALADEIAEARNIGVQSFPSLRLCAETGCVAVSIDYNEPGRMYEQITALTAR